MDPIQTQIPAPTAWNPYNLVWDATAQAPMQNTVAAQVSVQAVPPQKEGILEKIVKWVVRLIAKASGNADPLTGAPNPIATPGVAPASQGFFGQLGWAISGIASTAQNLAGGAISWVQNVGGQVVWWVQNVAGGAISWVQQVGQTVQSGVAQVVPVAQPTVPLAPTTTPDPVVVVVPQAPVPPTQ